jgi:hypothetical protein
MPDFLSRWTLARVASFAKRRATALMAMRVRASPDYDRVKEFPLIPGQKAYRS